MNINYTKIDKGYDVYINNQWVMWVIGSKANAKKEITEYLNNISI